MSFYDMISKLNQDNYENRTDVDTLEELQEDMVKFFREYDMLGDVIDIDLDDFRDDEGQLDELAILDEEDKQIYNYINSIIEWKGAGEYCVAGYQYGETKIMKVEKLLEIELDYFVGGKEIVC